MAKVFHATILTREGIVYQGSPTSLVAPGEAGYLGILADHRSLATALVPGKITIKDPEGKITTFKSPGNGFLEVSKNEVTILLDEALYPVSSPA